MLHVPSDWWSCSSTGQPVDLLEIRSRLDKQPNRAAWVCLFWDTGVDYPPTFRAKDWLSNIPAPYSNNDVYETPPACCTDHRMTRTEHCSLLQIIQCHTTDVVNQIMCDPSFTLNEWTCLEFQISNVPNYCAAFLEGRLQNSPSEFISSSFTMLASARRWSFWQRQKNCSTINHSK